MPKIAALASDSCIVRESARTGSALSKIELRVALGEPILGLFAVRVIDADAKDPLRTSFAVEGNETACLDPSNLSARPNDTILYAVLAPPIAESLASSKVRSLYVLWVQAGEAPAARNFLCPL